MNKNLYQNFTEKNGGQRITKWLRKGQLDSVAELFIKYHGIKCYGKEYIIKSNRTKRNTKWAIFICKENKLRRETDIMFKEKMNLIDLLCMIKKQEGVSVLKTLSMYL